MGEKRVPGTERGGPEGAGYGYCRMDEWGKPGAEFPGWSSASPNHFLAWEVRPDLFQWEGPHSGAQGQPPTEEPEGHPALNLGDPYSLDELRLVSRMVTGL